MKEKIFRLGSYKILENLDESLSWESYAGFGRTQTGRCSIESHILFLGRAIGLNESGFLIMEYDEALNTLPQWVKTPYYCTGFKLRLCCNNKIISTQSISKKLEKQSRDIHLVTKEKKLGLDNKIRPKNLKASVYKLGRYKIIDSENGELRWCTFSHCNRLRIGKAFIRGEILFLNGEIIAESRFSRKEFLRLLSLLPIWEETIYYCTNYSLKLCRKKMLVSGIEF